MTDAERGKVDHIFLACNVLGMDFQHNPHDGLFACFLKKDPTKHLSDLDLNYKKRMILWPRGLFKTSAVIVEIIQLILNYPNIRILIMSGSRDLAMSQLERVKRTFEEPTDTFRILYPDYCGTNLGNKSKFTIPNRTMKIFAEATVTISTARSVKAGTHYDVIFVDDLVNDQNYKNPAALEKCWEDYKDIGPVLEPSGYLFVTGTRYSFGDTYERIQDAAKKEMKETGTSVWNFSIRTCWRDINGKREVLFPQFRTKDGRTIGHTVKFLESEKREKGDEFFACQYENDPIGSGLQTFTDELLDAHTVYHFEKPMMESEVQRIAAQVQILTSQGKSFDQAMEETVKKPGRGEVPLGGWCFVIGDLSYVGDERNGHKRDKCVFFVIRVVNGRLYLIAAHAGKWKSGEVAEQIIFLLLKYRPRQIWCEAFLGWEAYDTVIRMIAAERRVQHLPLEWLPMDNQPDAKVVRIGSVHGWLFKDKLYIFAGIEGYQELRDNLKKFPKLGRFDDYGDCLGLGVNAPHGVALYQSTKEITSTLEQIKARIYPNGLPWSQEYNEREESSAGNGCGTCIVS